MSLISCINRAVASGLMDPDRGRQAKELFSENLDQAKMGLSGDEALAAARERTLREIRHALGQVKREKLLQVSRARGIWEQAQAAGVPLDRAMLAVLSQDPGAKGIANIETRHKTIRGMAHSRMNDFLERYRKNLVGENRNKAELYEIGREAFGHDSGNAAAREMAEAWSETAEWLRKMFNQAGGDIPKRDRWGLPQSHDSIAVRSAGFDKWYSDIRKGVDLSKMKDYATGSPMTEFSFKEAARDAFDAIGSEGWSRRDATGAAYGQKLSRRRMDHRFFEFKNFDAWLEYHNTYGSGDVFSVMMGHIDGMSRDISALQILGPNPTSMIRWMGEVVEKDAMMKAAKGGAKNDAPESGAKAAKRTMQLLWDYHSGSMNSPINGKVARSFAGTRSILQSAQLGAAALSAVTDLGFQKIAADQVGIPFTRIMQRYANLLNPKNVDDQKIAVRLGLIAEQWASHGVAQQRYLGEVAGPEVANRVTDFVMRVTGLSPWTQAGRWGFGMEFMGMMADNVGLKFSQLDADLQRTFRNHGITSHDWDIARRAPLLEHGGASFLRPEDVGEESVSLKILDMINAETEFAVPSTSARGRVAIIGENKPGTITGELIRSVAMYKNFAATLMFNHYRRMMDFPTWGERGKYFAQFFLTATAMGALAMQMKDISKGRDPRAMIDFNDPAAMAKFWGAAAMQGGGMGIFGDFLFAQQNRYGGGLASTIAGPMIGAAADFTGYFNENRTALMEGDGSKILPGAIDIAQRYMPGGSIWWARAGMENLIWDQMRKIADPNYEQRIRKLEKRLKKDYGQDAWWKRGDIAPTRAPNASAIFGG